MDLPQGSVGWENRKKDGAWCFINYGLARSREKTDGRHANETE